jgi:hypothetical protein
MDAAAFEIALLKSASITDVDMRIRTWNLDELGSKKN